MHGTSDFPGLGGTSISSVADSIPAVLYVSPVEHGGDG